MDECKGMIKRNVRNRCETWISEISSKKQRRKNKSRKNNRRKAQPHPDDDEQLQGDKEQPRAPTITWVVHGGIELVLI
jgi:hypothetical protein